MKSCWQELDPNPFKGHLKMTSHLSGGGGIQVCMTNYDEACIKKRDRKRERVKMTQNSMTFLSFR